MIMLELFMSCLMRECFCFTVCVSLFLFVFPCLRLFWEDQVQLTRSEACALPAWQAVHCAMHTGQPPLDRHQPVAILVETSGCCRRGSRLNCQQVSLPPSGGAPDRSAPVQVCGLAPLARLTVLLALGAPLQQSAASALPEGSHRASCRGKTAFENFGSAINRNAK